MKQRKGPEKDAAQKLREDYNRIVKRPLSPDARKEIEDFLKNQKPETDTRPKKVGKPNQDAEV